MLAAVAAFRLLGWGGAALAAAVILLTHQESGAPGWLWINLFVAVALLRFVPEGRLRAWVGRYQFVSLVALGFVLIAFGVQQYRFALHPQLMPAESVQALWAHCDQRRWQRKPRAMPAADGAGRGCGRQAMRRSVRGAANREALRGAVAMRGSVGVSEPKRLERYAPDAMLQTGPGIPNWSYLTYRAALERPGRREADRSPDDRSAAAVVAVAHRRRARRRGVAAGAGEARLRQSRRIGVCRRGDPAAAAGRAPCAVRIQLRTARARAGAGSVAAHRAEEAPERAGEVRAELRRSRDGHRDRQRRSTGCADGSARAGERRARHPAGRTAMDHRARHRRRSCGRLGRARRRATAIAGCARRASRQHRADASCRRTSCRSSFRRCRVGSPCAQKVGMQPASTKAVCSTARCS